MTEMCGLRTGPRTDVDPQQFSRPRTDADPRKRKTCGLRTDADLGKKVDSFRRTQSPAVYPLCSSKITNSYRIRIASTLFIHLIS
jgi:hypothetical protein